MQSVSDRRRTLMLVFALATLSNLVFYCGELPLIRIAEEKLCGEHVGNPFRASTKDGGEHKCKTPSVQNEVAAFIGFKSAFDAIPPLLTSAYYGLLASRRGRKAVIALACTGEVLNLLWVVFICFSNNIPNLHVAWLAAGFLLVGGGQFVLYAMFGLVVVDVAQEEHRSRYLAMLHSITLVSSLVGAPISAVLLEQSLAAPFLMILLLCVCRYPIIWMLTETGPTDAKVQAAIKANLANDVHNQETETLLAAQTPVDTVRSSKLYGKAFTLLKLPGLSFCFACFLVKRVAFTSEILMYQSIAERLDLPLENTAWLRIPIGLGAALTLLLMLPIALRYLAEICRNRVQAEAVAVRLNLVVLIAGFAIFWLSTSGLGITFGLVLCGIGEGLAPSLQALSSSLVSSGEYPDLFTTISIVDTIAKLIGGPIMAEAFSFRNASGSSYGFCFLLSSLLFSILLCSSWVLRRSIRR